MTLNPGLQSSGELPALWVSLEPHLSISRLTPYLKAMKGNHKKAIQLYHWNITLSGAAYEALHVFEVVLRNAIDRQLRSWNATQLTASSQFRSTDWLFDPAHVLVRLLGEDKIAEAKSRAQTAVRKHRRPLLHQDVLAQMSFSSWRFLMPDKDPGRQRLWLDCLQGAFPHLSRSEGDLTAAVAAIYEFRNRVAHMEPLLDSANAREQYNNMRDVLGEIDPAVQTWFLSNQRVTAALKSRPLNDD